MSDIIQIRRVSSVALASANNVYADGELVFEKNTKKFKLGDGSTPWNSLNYVAAIPAYLEADAFSNALNTASVNAVNALQAGAGDGYMTFAQLQAQIALLVPKLGFIDYVNATIIDSPSVTRSIDPDTLTMQLNVDTLAPTQVSGGFYTFS